MMVLRVTPPVAEVEEAEKEGGTAEDAGFVDSTRGCFIWSWTLLRRIEPMLMAPMVVKRGERRECENNEGFT